MSAARRRRLVEHLASVLQHLGADRRQRYLTRCAAQDARTYGPLERASSLPTPRHLLRGTATMLASASASASSMQLGAALVVNAFETMGPGGVVAVRQVVAAAVLMPAARPPVRRLTWPQWWPVLLLAVVFATMNFSLLQRC